MKRRLSVLILAAVVGALLAAACTGHGHRGITGSGHIITEQKDFSGFTVVDAENIFNTEIIQSDSFGIAITGDDNILDRVKVSEEEGTLKLRLERRRFHHINLKAVIAMPNLSGLNLDGISNVTVTGFKSSQDLNLDLSGASSLSGDLEAGNVVIEASGASRVILQGSASTLTLDASGASRIDLANFPVKNASVELSRISHATVNVSEKLDPVTLRGDSRLGYLGDPAFGEPDTSGDSAIHRK